MSTQDAGIAARAAAAQAVHAVLHDGTNLDRALAAVTSRIPPGRERAQVRALAFGALRWHCRHRALLGLLLNRPLRARDRILESLLSVGLFELEYGHAPGYAAVSAGVAAARRLGRPRATGLINGVLRSYQRDRDQLLNAIGTDPEALHAHPAWLLHLLQQAWPADWEALCRKNQEAPPMWLRVNTAMITVADYSRALDEAGFRADPVPGFDTALRLAEAVDVFSLPGFDAGQVSVQDAASQLAAPLLDAGPGMRVLDACAAPGGKSLHLLERAAGDLRLQALDVDADRLERLHENLRRAGFQAEVTTGDAAVPADWWDGELFDRILVDAPCSATGVIRRHPDIRFLRRDSDLPALAERQQQILAALWPLLRPGGRLIYATCSVLPVENRAVARRFLDATPDAAEVGALAGPVLAALAGDGPGHQLLPHLAETDGFYYLVLQKHDAS